MLILAEIISAIAALAPQMPEIEALVKTATEVATTGVVTPEIEAQVRAQLDAVRAAVDAA